MASKNGLQWFEEIENHENFWIEKAKIGIAIAIDKQLATQKISRSGLAERLKKSASYITKLLRGDENVTVATMVRIARALNCELHIHMAPKAHQVRWIEEIEGSKAAVGQFMREPIVRVRSQAPTWANTNAA